MVIGLKCSSACSAWAAFIVVCDRNVSPVTIATGVARNRGRARNSMSSASPPRPGIQIEDDGVWLQAGIEQRQDCLTAISGNRQVSGDREDAREEVAHTGFVVNDEDNRLEGRLTHDRSIGPG